MQTEPIEVLDARADALIEDHENMMRDLRTLRERHDLTQETVAERMGVTQPSVSQFERYDANPRLDTVRRYAMAVGARIHTRVIDDAVTYSQPTQGPSATYSTPEASQHSWRPSAYLGIKS